MDARQIYAFCIAGNAINLTSIYKALGLQANLKTSSREEQQVDMFSHHGSFSSKFISLHFMVESSQCRDIPHG